MAPDRISVLFVCLGNICRSPLAEGIFRHLVEAEGLGDRFTIDSAGTSGYHEGESPDPRTTEVARRRGITLSGRAREIGPGDLEQFDYIVVMDAENLEQVRSLAVETHHEAEVHLLRSFDPTSGDDLDVPDPYFRGNFEHVHDVVERACKRLLRHIRSEHAL